MLQDGRVLGVIPARGGSKRLPRKNVALLGGRPLIAWTVAAARASRLLDAAIVSTDDPEIAEAARAAGAAVPFRRPPELARDESSAVDVVRHALAELERAGEQFEFVVLLQPTSPLRDAAEIDAALDLLQRKGADAVISVCPTEHHPLWANTLPPDRSLAGFLREDVRGKRSQELPPYYRLNGAVYACRTARLLSEGTFFLRDRIYAHVMPPEKSVDVDSALDLAVCAALLRAGGSPA